MVVTTISCDAQVLHCTRCAKEIAIVASATATIGTCVCGGALAFDRNCARSFALRKDSVLIRCIAENRDGWRHEDRGDRDFCPDHAHLADPARSVRPPVPAPDGQILETPAHTR